MFTTIYEALAAVTTGASVDETPRLTTVEFGDGYRQVTPAGMHALERKLTLAWTMLAPETATSLIALLKQGLAVAFIAPGDRGPRYWLPTTWTRTSPSEDLDNVTVEFMGRLNSDRASAARPSIWDAFGSSWDAGASIWDL